MDKVLKFLEKYVQWIAVGIGGAIFLYSIWVYWLEPKALTAEVGTRRVGPGQVDAAVNEGQGRTLRREIETERGLPTPVIDHMGPFVANLNFEGYTPPRLASALNAGMPLMGVDMSAQLIEGNPSLAEIPAAKIRKLASGRSFAQVPGDAGQIAAQDLAEVRVDFVIPVDQIASAFRKAAIQDTMQNTAVLRIELQRQRRMADGAWGEESTIPLLVNNPLDPLPANNADMAAKQRFLESTVAAGQWVLQPEFFALEAGDDPNNLTMVIEVDENGQATTRPAEGGGANDNGNNAGDEAGEGAAGGPFGMSGGTSNDAGITHFGNRQDDPRGNNRGNNAGGQTPPGGRPNTPDYPAPGRPQPGAQPQNPPVRPQPQPPVPGQPQNPNAGDNAPPAPAGEFNPAQGAGGMEGWAWDITAQPGETYRYRVVYFLKNPVFGAAEGVVKNKPEIAQQLAIRSATGDDDWSPPITVEPLVYYYLTQTTPDRQTSTFTVFRWQEGRWQSESFKLSPGDPVGYLSNGIDFRTGKTLVDIRADQTARQDFALLVDAEGRFSRRTIEDAQDPQLRQLQQLASGVAENR